VTKCPVCKKGKLERLISQTSFALQGSGWYKTDYERKSIPSDAGEAKSSSPPDTGGDDGGKGGKGDKKKKKSEKSEKSEKKESSEAKSGEADKTTHKSNSPKAEAA
jgi:hypothetical protein